MKAFYRVALGVLIVACGVFLFRALIGGSIVSLFMPQGAIASQESALVKTITILMLVVVVPMFTLLYFFAWKYRAENRKAKYEPERSSGFKGQIFLWLVPAALMTVLGVLNWQSAHALDPYKTIAVPSTAPAHTEPLNIQVVAMTWKWLFIYPQQHIATVNYMEFPENTPIHLDLTADAPMSSFWIPQLGSQIYAMNAMMTQLSLIASSTGEYTGKDTEINGDGYAGMTFTAKSVSLADFNNWVTQVQQSTSTLDAAAYNALAAPSTYNPPAYYASVMSGLFDKIMMKYMMPTSTSTRLDYPGFVTTTAPASSGAQTMAGMTMQ